MNIKEFFKNLFSPNKKEEPKEEENYSPYCPKCEACGEEGCCSALACIQDPDGHYCEGYLRDLKFTYSLHRDFIKHIYENKEKYKDLIELYDKKWDEKHDIFYNQED